MSALAEAAALEANARLLLRHWRELAAARRVRTRLRVCSRLADALRRWHAAARAALHAQWLRQRAHGPTARYPLMAGRWAKGQRAKGKRKLPWVIPFPRRE